ncbi:MAG: ABC transporter permease subunit [Clostridiales bacterium]|nr:ABC transporter permease subunit [Clostridiales bacterium]
MRAIFRREMQSYFYTPAAYVFMGVFLALTSVFFGVNNLAGRSSNLMTLIAAMSYLWMLLSPVLTMRLIAGERRQRTDQLLFSSPVSLAAVVCGKYLAACAVLLATVAVSFVYCVLVAIYGTLYVAETLVAYLGVTLHGCAFIALDLFFSCFCRSQMTAVLMGLGVNLMVWIADIAGAAATAPALSRLFDFVSLYRRFEPFAQGQLRFSNVLYLLLFIFIMLFMSVRVLDARRWSEA